MIRHLTSCGLFLFPLFVSAQCISGDCNNGHGKYDFSYAVYEGDFKNGKPHGQGTIDYGGGDKYVGQFVNGKEEGKGLLYTSRGIQSVKYINGVIQNTTDPVAIGGNDVFQNDIKCEGNCSDGFGTIRFPSGNVYTGNFKGGKFSGSGKMRFASGNILEGEFIDHTPQSGTFTYADGTVFKGTFNADGTPASGKYSSAETGGVVQISNGAITKVSNPRIDSLRAAQPKYESSKCTYCKGNGFNVVTSTKYEQLTPNVYQASSTGFASLVSAGQSLKTKSSSQVKCTFCSGSGTITKQKK